MVGAGTYLPEELIGRCRAPPSEVLIGQRGALPLIGPCGCRSTARPAPAPKAGSRHPRCAADPLLCPVCEKEDAGAALVYLRPTRRE